MFAGDQEAQTVELLERFPPVNQVDAFTVDLAVELAEAVVVGENLTHFLRCARFS